MIKFNDIMKKFYEDESLGIQQEDEPANSVAGGGVSLPADAVSKKKQKEIQKDCKTIKVLAYSSAIQRQKRLYE